MILGDRHALNRNPFTGEPLGEPEWDNWDYVLINALQLIEDFTDEHGLLVWERDSDDVLVEAVKKTHPFLSARDRATSKKNYKQTPGEYWIPRTALQSWATEWPTFKEWVDDQRETTE